MECYNLIIFLFSVFLGLACGEVIRTQKCHLPAGQKSTCTVHEVRINPCPESVDNKPCKIKLGSNATLSFDYTPTFSSDKVGSHAYKVGAMMDIAFEQMDTNGCKYTNCPIEANKKQEYNYALEIGTQFPATAHQVKWKLWSEGDYHNQCCLKFSMQLID